MTFDDRWKNALVKAPGTSVERAVQAVATRAGLELPYLGASQPFPNEHRVYPGRQTDWVVGPAQSDPLYRRADVVPREQRARVKQIQRLLDFPDLYIAHEIEKVGNSIPAIRRTHYRAITPEVASTAIAIPERPTTKALNAIRDAKDRYWEEQERLAQERAARRAVKRQAEQEAAVRDAISRRPVSKPSFWQPLDPMVLGLMPIPEWPGMSAWFILAQWVA